jgi:uncharacterized membrane-anchored protein YjiN (DUF445 family)
MCHDGQAQGPSALTGPVPSLPEEALKLAALRRVKLVATGALALCIALFAAARLLERRWPAIGIVAAFAEAAAIGGLADWYAVVALFKRPLGLPIPHTAIIPANQDRIADNLGRFIEVNFLASAAVREKLKTVDFAALVADWLSDERRADGLSRFVTRLVPQTLRAIEDSELRGFIAARLIDQVQTLRIGPLAAGILASFTEDRRHQRLFDEAIRALGHFLTDEEALAALRKKIREELPTLANLFGADAYLLRRIVASAGSLLVEVEHDPDHPLRREFDRFVLGFIERLRESPEYAERAERLKQDILARPELRNLAENVWASLRAFVEQDASAPQSAIRRHLVGLFVDVGRQLGEDPRVRADMNQGFVIALASFVENQKSGVSAFIAEQVKRWDLGQLTRLIEIHIGRDLQYIRFNGMIIGGLAGVALYLGERLILAG